MIQHVSFETYRALRGELEKHEFEKVIAHPYTQPEYDEAHAALSEVMRIMGKEQPPNKPDVETAAKLIGALGKRVPRQVGSDKPHGMWLMTESILLRGKT